MVRDENLDFWVQNNYNVLFVGHAGVGKTSIVRSVFDRHNLNHRYFSASTMDPWVDLVGVPKERIDENGEAYLDLIRPKGLDQVEAFFFDEFNRSHKKVRNACMELLQFKTINGRHFPNLKLIWAAINPDDDLYDVERLDPAQKDRFHIYVEIPYKPDQVYFVQKYGEREARSAISWWNELEEDTRKLISPRRLDYALDIFSKEGDIRFVLPEESNVSKLLTTLKYGPILDTLDRLYKLGDLEEARKWLSSENNYQAAIPYIKKSDKKIQFFLPLINGERLATLAADKLMLRAMLKYCVENEMFAKTLRDIYESKQNSTAFNEIKKAIDSNREVGDALGYDSNAAYRQWPMGTDPVDPYFAQQKNDKYAVNLAALYKEAANIGGTTIIRIKLYDYIYKNIPEKMTSEEAILTLKSLNVIALRSQYTTLKKLDKMIGIFNQCIRSIYRIEGRTISQIVKRYSGSNFRGLWKKIRADKFLSAGVIPYGLKQDAA